MLAFRIEVDGEPVVTAGVDDWSILAFHITASRSREVSKAGDGVDYSVGGLSVPNSEKISHHFRWPRGDLSIGSSVTVTVIETDSPDPPAKRYRSDRELQESPYTEAEMREMRRQDYLDLKIEFEGASDA